MPRRHSREDSQLPLLIEPKVTTWLPDESLFSLASRYHRVAGNMQASATCQQLFGHAQRGSQHDLPSRIDEFVGRTRGLLGEAEEIIGAHTLLPFYLPFRSLNEIENAISAMRGDGIGSLKFRLGILTSRFRAHHPLKACLQCMQDDRIDHQVAYWHLSHQYPGIWTCPRHDTFLLEATVKSTGVGRFLWHLPSERSLIDVLPKRLNDTDKAVLKDLLKRIGTASRSLAQLPMGYMLDMQHLMTCYSNELRNRRLCTTAGRLRLEDISKQYVDFVGPLRVLPEFASVPSSLSEAKVQIGRLLRTPRTGTHPLRHLLLITWLFGTWDKFWVAYQLSGPGSWIEEPQPLISVSSADSKVNANAEKESRLIELLSGQSYSITRAAKEVGIEVATAMAWAAQARIEIARRPKVLKPDVRAQLIKGLRKGLDKKYLATQYGISIQTVTLTLRTEPGLQQTRHDVLFSLAQKRARKAWSKASHQNPGAGIKVIRLMEPATYAWLYRNDRQWLQNQTSTMRKPKKGNHSKINWDERDRKLALSVREVCLELIVALGSPKRITLQQIYQRLPELRAKLSRLGNLPLTSLAIEEAVRLDPTPTDFPRLFL